MVRLIFFGVVLVTAAIAWVGKAAAGAVSGNEGLKGATFKGETKRTMEGAARGINWLEKQWDEAKGDANKN